MNSKAIIIIFSVILLGLTSCGDRSSNKQTPPSHQWKKVRDTITTTATATGTPTKLH